MSKIENETQGSKARSPVIDLEAEDISPPTDTGDSAPPSESEETPAAEEAVSSPPPKAPSIWMRNRITAIIAVVAAIAATIFYHEYGFDLWPPSSVSKLGERLAAVEASNQTLNDQLVSLGGTLDTLKADASKRAGTSADEASALAGRLDEVEKAVTELRQSIVSLPKAGGGGADPAALADLDRRVAKLEQTLADLGQGNATPSPPQEASPLPQMLADLKAKFAVGAPYKDELDRIAVYVPESPDVATLMPDAATGIANAQSLAADLERLVPDLSQPSPGSASTNDTGFWAWVGTVVKVRDLDTLDWADLARAAANDAKAGDLRAAIAKLEEPGGDLPQALVQWRERAQQRLKAEDAFAQLVAAVSAVIMGKP
jgi:hypothetical protein